jgi:hypothetical protein
VNDELSGQLTSTWPIPSYAQDALWLASESEVVPTEGEYGLFTLSVPSQSLVVRWGGADGPALARMNWQADTLDWRGTVRMGGYVDAIHVTQIPNITYPITVIFMGGQPLRDDMTGYPTGEGRSHIPYPAPEFYSGLASDTSPSVTTWLVPDESPLAGLAQNAIMDNLRLHFYGRLASDESEWGAHFALPILLQSVTLFGP